MGLTKWIGSKLIFSLLIFAGFSLLAAALGVLPKSVENVFSWFANNFVNLGLLIISFMVLLVIYRALGKRRQPT